MQQDDGEFGARQTSARWKLQHKRQVLNHKIFRQTKLRDGAENLMKALRLGFVLLLRFLRLS